MKVRESEVLKIKFTDQEISDFRTLMIEVLQATRKTGFGRLELTDDAQKSMNSIISELTE
jgi:stress response protein SCP2